MRLGPLGIPELAIILLIIMMIFGAKRLPEIGSSLGRGIRTFKSAITGEEEKGADDQGTASALTSKDDPT